MIEAQEEEAGLCGRTALESEYHGTLLGRMEEERKQTGSIRMCDDRLRAAFRRRRKIKKENKGYFRKMRSGALASVLLHSGEQRLRPCILRRQIPVPQLCCNLQ